VAQARFESIRITKVGLWYVLLTLLVAIAATNTGNNALYLAWAIMLGLLVVSGIVSRQNLRCLELELVPPGEIHAHQPVGLGFRVESRGRLWPRWVLLLSLAANGRPWLLPFLPRRGQGKGEFELAFERRGRQRLDAVHVASLFPFGLFRKGVRYALDLEVLVFPELFAAASYEPEAAGEVGLQADRRSGRGHDPRELREFRDGDDPRAIHWKQTARTGRTIVLEREAEENRRLSILFDNTLPAAAPPAAREGFERLVSEAATAAVDHLRRGWEVELVTRDLRLPFATGHRQRWSVLEALALVEPHADGAAGSLRAGDAAARVLALGGGRERAA
jgi:uncharacterized protein (DUF58 family)